MAKNWSDREIDVIVRDYFVMLEHEQTGRAFSKTEHRRVLLETLERSKKSIEFKHCNISAVMDFLGLLYIAGYKPLKNFQKALFKAVEAQLNQRPNLYKLLSGESEPLQYRIMDSFFSEAIVFDKVPPKRETPVPDIPKEIESIVSRFEHPAERDAKNRSLGRAGELLVYEYERRRLQAIGRKDLSDHVRWVTRNDGDGYGYDVLSFNGEGDEADREQWLEVKTTNGSATTPFCISRRELHVSEQRPDAFRIFRLYDFRKQVRAYCLTPPLESHVSMAPSAYRAYF